MYKTLTEKNNKELGELLLHFNQSQAASKTGSWEWNIQENTIWWSDQTYELFDVNKSSFEVSFESYLSLLTDESKEIVSREVYEILEKGNEYEHIISLKLNPEKKLKGYGYLIKDDNNQNYKLLGSIQDVSAEIKLKKEKETLGEELTQLIDTANAPIFGIDINGNVNEWNQKAAKITGYSKNDVTGKPFVETYITKEYKTSVKNVLDQALKGKETSNYEVPIFTKNGNWVMVLLNATTRRNVKGDIIGVVGVGQDITEIDNVRLEKSQIADELTQLIDTANAPIFGIDTKGNVNEWNQKAAEITGYTKQDVTGKPFVDTYITSDYKKSVNDVLNKALAGTDTSNYEVPIYTKINDRVLVLLNATTRRNVKGEIIGVVGVGQDITELDNVRKDLTISNTRWQSVIKNDDIAVTEINLNFEITFVSNILRSTKDIFKKENVLGSNIFNFHEEEEWENIYKPKFDKLLKTGEYFSYDTTFNHNGLNVSIHNQIFPINENNKVVGFICISSDITEQKKLEEKSKLLQQKREALSQEILSIQENERKRIARYVHDEIGQQLASLKINLELIKKETNADKRDINLNLSLNRIQNLISTSRTIAKELRPPQLDLLGLEDALKTLIKESEDKSIINFKSNINIAKKFSENLSETIYRIIQEGIENCIKHSSATSVEINLKTTLNKLSLSIMDNGQGIRKQDLNKKGSFGLIGIEERLIPHNGIMSITSTKPGCSLNIEVPL